MSTEAPRSSPARRAAWDVLSAWLVADASRARLGSKKRPFPPPSLAPRDRAFAKDIADGTVARRRALDAILDVATEGRSIRPVGLHAALLLSAWQLIFAPEVATHSVVNDGVELAKRAAGPGGGKFANAVLRRISELPDLEDWLVPPVADDVEASATWHSLPPVVVERWLSQFESEIAHRLFEACNTRAARSLRIEAHGSIDELAKELEEAGFVTCPGPAPRNLLVEAGRGSLLETKAFREGRISMQDATQIEVVETLLETVNGTATHERGVRVLDFCAAPGTKACAIAERIAPDGVVVAFDADAERLSSLRGEIERLRLPNVEIASGREDLDARAADRAFDAVLVDAPCSNSGVFARRSEARWRFSTESLQTHARAQREILEDASRFVAPGGCLVYSTCSIEAEENEVLARAFAETGPFRLISSERTLPEAGIRDGGGIAVFVRR